MPHKQKQTKEREHNQACFYFTKREGGRRSQMFVKACANKWNAKLALAFCNECSQVSPKAAGRGAHHANDLVTSIAKNRRTMQPPLIENSTKEERRAYVLDAWKCLHDCEACGKCRVLKGRDTEALYAAYINGERSYMDVTLEIRNNTLR